MPEEFSLALPGDETEEGKKKSRKDRERDKEREKEREKENARRAERGIETMFRTSYRMHTDLSSIADSKAGIMISINGLMVSIILAAIAPKIAATPWLMLPTSVMLVSGVLSLGFAVLAARPRVRTSTPAADGSRGGINLLFFGSFVSLSPREYEEGIDALVNDPSRMYRDMARDIYGLGTVLEAKFKLLRASYTVFLVGLVASVLLYMGVYLWIVFRTPPVVPVA